MITHGDTEKEWTQVRQGCGKASRARNEEAEKGNVAEWAWWEGGQGEEQEAGNCDRTFGGPQERREGAVEAEIERRAKEERWSKEDGWQKEASLETEVGVQLRSESAGSDKRSDVGTRRAATETPRPLAHREPPQRCTLCEGLHMPRASITGGRG